MVLRYILAAFGLALIDPGYASAQQPLVLGRPAAELAEPFSVVAGIRELTDGRVLVSDGREKALQIVRFGGPITRVGREGAGPGEYAIPSRIAALPGDTSAVFDAGNARYLIILPDGSVGPTFQLGDPGKGLGLAVRASPKGVDARGRIYYEGAAFQVNSAGDMIPADSAPIIRFDRATHRADTIAVVRLAKDNASARPSSGGGLQVTRGTGNPLTPRDDWVVLPDGRVAVIRSPDYRIDLYAARTSITRGPAVEYEKIAVDAAVKAEVEALRLRIRLRAVGITSGRGGAPSAGPPGRGSQLPVLVNWPDVMPPFLSGAAMVRPNGQIWVLRTQKPGNDAPLYEVFDSAGRIIGHVALPARTELVGFGRGTVYLVRTDDDDLQYLQLYRLADGANLSR